eukprot:scaffold294292_cov36-Tisochrysis_lutea.AAC.1
MQYLLYKHALLHGLNASVAATVGGAPLASSTPFRVYWLCLNTSYVMEFFLQTLVKKGYMLQESMLLLQALLMGASSMVAGEVVWKFTSPVAAVVSLLLNLSRRGHELSNTAITFASAVALMEAEKRGWAAGWTAR